MNMILYYEIYNLKYIYINFSSYVFLQQILL
jgi:hypothetical protein